MKTKFTVNELECIEKLFTDFPLSIENLCSKAGIKAQDIHNKLGAMYNEAYNEQQRKQQLMGKLQDAIAYNGMTTVEEVVGCYFLTNKQAKHLLRGNIDKFTLKELKEIHENVCEGQIEKSLKFPLKEM